MLGIEPGETPTGTEAAPPTLRLCLLNNAMHKALIEGLLHTLTQLEKQPTHGPDSLLLLPNQRALGPEVS